MLIENTRDIVVVGSSPLLLLYALYESGQGKRVCIVEKDPHWGGAWSLSDAPPDLALGPHEKTCHLIEWYRGGYELLSELSGASFVPLNPQPVKVFASGRITPYLSRPMIVTNVPRTLAYLGYNSLRLLWRTLAGDGVGAQKALRGNHFAFQRLSFEWRFRVKSINHYDCIRAPAGGYAQWMSDLLARVRGSSIEVVNAEALSASRAGNGGWLLNLSDGHSLSTGKLVVGESTTLSSVAGVALNDQTMTEYYHALVSTDASDTLIRSRYIHCADDPYLHRVSFLADVSSAAGGQRSCWLVQFRNSDMGAERIQNALAGLALRYPFLRQGAAVQVDRRFSDSFFRSPVHSALSYVSKDDFVVLRTIGDLSQNILFTKYIQGAFDGLQFKVV